MTAPISLVIKRSDSPSFYLTLIIGNNPNEAGFDDPEGQLISVGDEDGGDEEMSGDLDLFHTAGNTTYQTWEISEGSSDITIDLTGLPEGVGIARLSGIAIDVDAVIAPEILSQPNGGHFLAGSDVTLKVVAGGTAPEFQWYKDGEALPGETETSLVLNNIGEADSGDYKVMIENSAGSVESEEVEVSVDEILPDRLTNFQDEVTGESSLISLFSFDGANLNDHNDTFNGDASGSVSFVEGLGGGAAKAIGLDGSGHVNLGDGDSFDFFDLTGTVQAWVRADWTEGPGYNPCILADRDGGQVNYSLHMNQAKNQIIYWNGASAAITSIPAAGTEWHLVTAVFDDLSFRIYWDGTEVFSGDIDLGTSPEAPTQIGSSSPNGAELWIGALDEVAFFEDVLSAGTINDHYLAYLAGEPPIIRTEPVGGSFLVGRPLMLSVDAVGNSIEFQWTKDGEAIDGATDSVLEILSLSLDDAGTYAATVSNPAGEVQSQAVEIVIFESLPANLVSFQEAVMDQDGLISYYTFDDSNAEDSQGDNDGTIIGDAFFGEGEAGGASKSLVSNGGHLSFGAVDAFDFFDGVGSVQLWLRADWTSAPGYNPCIVSDRDGGAVNYSLHMNQDKNQILYWNGSAVSIIDIPDAGMDWHLFTVVFDFGTWAIYWDGQLVESLTHDQGVSFEVATHIGSSSTAGGEIWPGAFDEVAFFEVALTEVDVETMYGAYAAGMPPEILQAPVSARIFDGSQIELSVTARGAELSFQWYKDGELLDGETDSTLSLTDLTPQDGGNYHVVVSNSGGDVTSDTAVVKVVIPDLEAYQDIVSAEDNLISYYTFDDQTSDDTVSSNDGLESGFIDYQAGVGGFDDLAIILDGGSHIAFDAVEDFDFADGTGTVEAWVRPDWVDSPGYNPCIFANRDGGPVRWSVHMNLNKDGSGLWNGSTYSPQPINVADQSWHHFAIVYTGSETQIYWDGVLAGTSGQTLTGPAGPTQLGSSSNLSTTEGWIGALDEVALYSDALSAEVIQSHYEALAGPLDVTEPSISLVNDAGSLSILFEGGQLQRSSSVNGPWEDVPAATSPFSVSTSEDQQFYRVD